MSFIRESGNLRVPFQDIKKATQNFTTLIGRGGYGPVYRGELSLSGELKVVAVKRLQTDYGQGVKEFLTEIHLLSRYKHQNLVSLVGFCEEGNEKFLIYEYAENESLDKYIQPKRRCPLTWKKRIRICVDAARGLDHLHNRVAQNHRVIHRDIKSANILLDHNWKAMIADFGLSKIGRANENETFLITNACGTFGYCDPEYMRTGILTKESDVYSFGVVLLEVLCGRLCCINVNSEERFLAPLAKRYYEEGKLNLIIDPGLKNYMNSDSMKDFSEIAFQCLQDNRDQRPSMAWVLQKLEKALKLLELEETSQLCASEAKQMILPQYRQQKNRAGETPQNLNGGSGTSVTEEEQYLKDTLAAYRKEAAYRKAADAAARIEAAFREHSSKNSSKQVYYANTEDEAKCIIAAMRIQHAFRMHETKKQMAAATCIQSWFRTWQIRKDFLNKRRQAIIIQAYFRVFQATKQFKKTVWSVGISQRFKPRGFSGLQVAPSSR